MVSQVVDKGLIHSFESFSTLDGPGIRYVVFFTGCYFRCAFCHNIDMVECLPGTYKEYSVSAVLKKVNRARPYFVRSGGGVTLSGGEPFFQFHFMRDLLTEFRKEGIHSAIDTCLYTPRERIEQISGLVDLVLVGLKHIDPGKHRKLTGRDNDLVLKNIAYLDSLKKPFWIRYVVVPGVTNERDDILKLAEFLSPFSSLQRIDLLPYHRLGIKKWEAVNKDYTLSDSRPPSEEEMEEVRSVFQSFDLPLLGN